MKEKVDFSLNLDQNLILYLSNQTLNIQKIKQVSCDWDNAPNILEFNGSFSSLFLNFKNDIKSKELKLINKKITHSLLTAFYHPYNGNRIPGDYYMGEFKYGSNVIKYLYNERFLNLDEFQVYR